MFLASEMPDACANQTMSREQVIERRREGIKDPSSIFCPLLSPKCTSPLPQDLNEILLKYLMLTLYIIAHCYQHYRNLVCPRFALRVFVCTTGVGASTAGKRELAGGIVLAIIVISNGLWLIPRLTYVLRYCHFNVISI